MRGLLLTLLLLVASGAAAADRVRLFGGSPLSGRITGTTPEGLTLETKLGERTVAVDKIKLVILDGEPAELAQARLNVSAGGYRTALQRLSKVDSKGLPSDLAREDWRFYIAFCRARLAIAGAGDAKKAEKSLTAFVRGAPKSFHYYPAVEALGDLMVAAERYDRAQKFYGLIAKSRLASLKARARVLVARVSQARGEHGEAIRRFDAALAVGGSGDAVAREQRAARLGKAESVAAEGDLVAARRLVAGVVRALPEDDSAARAAAYNALGRAHLAADDRTGALLAYLHTDLLFGDDAETHAEALARLGPLLSEAGKTEAAARATERLRRRYAASKWARLAGGE